MMPKEKVQHKEKTKHAVEGNKNESYGKKLPDNPREEYLKFEDCETNKFNKRPIENNWSKYEANPSEFEPDEDDESHKTKDFDFLLKTASSDCSHFQFSSEKQWKNQESLVPSSKIFNLDLDLLSKGLGCLPFYERLGLNGSELSEEDRKSFDKAAAKNREDYDALCKNFMKSVVDDIEDKGEKPLDDSIVKKDLAEEKLKSENEDIKKLPCKVTDKGDEKSTKQYNEPKSEKKAIFTENLEDWLDSMLDD